MKEGCPWLGIAIFILTVTFAAFLTVKTCSRGPGTRACLSSEFPLLPATTFQTHCKSSFGLNESTQLKNGEAGFDPMMRSTFPSPLCGICPRSSVSTLSPRDHNMPGKAPYITDRVEEKWPRTFLGRFLCLGRTVSVACGPTIAKENGVE